MSKTKFRQCALEKSKDGITHRIVSYIPEKYAVVGEFLKLKDDNVWTDGWLVKFAGHIVDEPPDYRKEVRQHRRKENGEYWR